MNKPVAIRYDFDGYGYQYMDSGSGSDWQTRVDGEPLYTHPVKELTDEEIIKLADETCLTAWIAINPIMDIEKQKQIAKQKMIEFAKAILRKEQEK